MSVSHRVLLVEDERMMQTIVRDNLEFEGYQVVVVGTGEEAMIAALHEHPDVVLLDVMLPGIDGYEVCQRIRASGSDVPIIIISARITDGDRRIGFRAGADAYIGKPFNVRDLVTLVGRYTGPAGRKRRTPAAPRTPRVSRER